MSSSQDDGNSAAMRKALCMVLRYLQWLYAQGCTDRSMLSDEIDRVVSAINKPPRNCDRFETAEDAKKEFNYLWNFVWKRGGGYVAEREYRSEYEKWLFSVAINCIDTRRLKRLLCELVEADILDGGQINKTISAVEKAKHTLAEPPRNCDVGTAEEQYDRHDKYCNSQPTCRKCLREDAASMCISCFAKWAQMPYEEGGAK